ncbi:MAG: hypothetical protein V4489_01090, partial [Chlamydiota bacterium]
IGEARGEARGRVEGEAIGEARASVKIARRLLRENIPISIISSVSGLSESEIRALSPQEKDE